MTKVTIKKADTLQTEYPKIMINVITGSIFWFNRECVGVFIKKGELDMTTNQIATMCLFNSMEHFINFNDEIVLQNV